MPGTYFISDLHLDADRPELFSAFKRFLGQHTDAEALYILGDLFEVWVGDDDDAPLARDTCELLANFSQAGPDLFFMRGNRDFLVGEDFSARTGATLLNDPTVIDLYGSPTLLMHGDTLCTQDTDYQAFRTEVRSKQWQQEILAQPLARRRVLAQRLREDSGAATAGKPAGIMDVAAAEVSRVMHTHGVQQLIHGHTHRPNKHEEPSGRRWVLGDWGASGWFLKASPPKIELINFYI